MKKGRILLKTIITVVASAPPALLAIENLSMRPIKHPRPVLIKVWNIEDKTHDGRMRYLFTIHEDGTVEGTVEAVRGTVGSVIMKDAYLNRNRHWLSKMFGRRTDYKIMGGMETSPIEEPREYFWIEFNCDKQGTMTKIKAGF